MIDRSLSGDNIIFKPEITNLEVVAVTTPNSAVFENNNASPVIAAWDNESNRPKSFKHKVFLKCCIWISGKK